MSSSYRMAPNVDVGCRASELRCLALGLLGGHVTGRAEHGAGLGVAVLGIEAFGQAEVSDLGDAALRQQNVGRLQIAVQNALLVGVLNGVGQVENELGGGAAAWACRQSAGPGCRRRQTRRAR